MKEKSGLNVFDDVLAEYGVTEFDLDLVNYFHEFTCVRAIRNWKDSWPFCPTCGASFDMKGLMPHNNQTLRPH